VLYVVEPGGLPRTPLTLAALAGSLLGAWLINFFTMALIGVLAFFIESSSSIFEIWLVAFMLLSGYLVPIELFPPALRAASAALPFRYTLAFPVEVLTGLVDRRGMLEGLAAQWAYVVGTGGLALLAWRAGLRRFAAYGG
jgi:ABC-2 type transport system permease protein